MANNAEPWTPERIADHNTRVERERGRLKQLIEATPQSPPAAPTPPVIALPKTKKNDLNKTELRYLALLGSRGYQDIRIHSIRFRIAGKCYYTPEFYCCHEGRQYIFEVKGRQIWEDSIIKLKATAALWPAFIFVLAKWDKNQWTEKTINL